MANDVTDHIFGRLRLSRPALSADDAALSHARPFHGAVNFVGHSENVWRQGLSVLQFGIEK